MDTWVRGWMGEQTDSTSGDGRVADKQTEGCTFGEFVGRNRGNMSKHLDD